MSPKTLFQQIQKTDYKSAPVTLWIVTRKKSKDASVPDLDPGEDMEDPRFFEFRVRQLNMEGDLSTRLAKVVDRAIQGAKKLEPYAFEGAVENRTAMVESLKATGFSSIQDLIATAGPKDVVTEEKHLHLAYGYVLHAQPASGPSVYAFRRLQRSWKVNTVSGVINALFKKKILIDASDEKIFRFESKIDFYAVGDYAFILNKTGFESALNFRVGMQRKRTELIIAIKASGLYENIEALDAFSQTHVRWLKKLASANDAGKCTKPDWIKQLETTCKSRGLNLEFRDGRIIISPDSCELLVKLMNDDIVESIIDKELFEINGAKTKFSAS